MYTSGHTMKILFSQLGLDSSEASIDEFISKHRLAGSQTLDQASFWSPVQAEFIRESWQDDSDWAIVVDQLDTLLRD